MSPREQSTEAISDHEGWQRPDRTWECACGQTFGFKLTHSEHVADAVVEALGLTEERGYMLDFEGKHEEPDAWFPASSYNTSRAITHTRWVSGWSVVAEEKQ